MQTKHQLLFVQGGGTNVHDEWDDKLVENLKRRLGPDYEIRYPQMPKEDDPRYATWKATLENDLAALDDRAILVGHSIGGTILVNVLAEQPPGRMFAAILLIAAPFVGDGGWSSNELNSARDLGARLPQAILVHIYHGLKDATVPSSHTALYASAVPQARIHRLPDRDHQLNNDLSEVAAMIMSLDARG